MNGRTQRANQMMTTKGYCSQISTNKFSVRSQSNPDKRYLVRRTGNGLVCECPDCRFRKADCKHIKIVLDVVKSNKCWKTNTFHIMERSQLKVCKYCDSGRLIKNGFRENKSNIVRIFKCLDCKRKFTANFGFEKMKHDPKTITQSIQMYYQGMSFRDVANNLEMIGIDICPVQFIDG